MIWSVVNRDVAGPFMRATIVAPRLAFARLADPNGIPIQLELDLGVRQQSESLAKLLRNGHLAFSRNPHRYYSYW